MFLVGCDAPARYAGSLRTTLFLLLALPLPASLPPELKDIRTGAYAQATPAAGPIRVLDWNIDRGVRLEEIEQSIASQRPALCLLQEVDWNAARSHRVDVADALARRLQLNFAFAAAFEELGQGSRESPAWQGQATLAAFPIRNSRILRFSRQTAFWEPRGWIPSKLPLLQRRVGGRIALISELDVGGRTLVVYNLHLESRGLGYTRYAQLEETVADARRYGPGVPVLLAGDLNTKYAASRFSRLLENNGFRDCLARDTGKTHRIAFRLDWIFVRGPAGCDAGAVDRAAHGSDHYALTTLVNLR